MADDDVETLMALLNSRPVVDGVERDELSGDRHARRWARAHGGVGSAAEAERLRTVRDGLRDVVLGEAPASVLQDVLDGVHRVPVLEEHGVDWELIVPEDSRLPVRAVLGWARSQRELPGRLRPCGNDECQLFLLDRSRANKARWCSMATCGNRMKARRHYERNRAARRT